MSELDLMRAAMVQGELARGISTPNPPVGAVVVDGAGTIVGRGHTQPAGGAHAEVVALRQAGSRARGATAVVTLEPCNHTGRTGPCTQALIDAGISRVVFAVTDPNPQAAGGAAALQAAGVHVEAGVGVTEASEGALHAWLFRYQTGRPRVTVKIAATLDGRTAAADGTSQWITGTPARDHVHAERARIDAVVVGTGTVLADNPALTSRLPDGTLRERQPHRIVLGTTKIPMNARVNDGSSRTTIIASRDPFAVIDAAGDALEILVEGGPRTLGAFVAADLVDRVQAYIAPMILGGGNVAVCDTGIGTMGDAFRLQRRSVEVLGEDILVTCLR